jgi:hypothetical protein
MFIFRDSAGVLSAVTPPAVTWTSHDRLMLD